MSAETEKLIQPLPWKPKKFAGNDWRVVDANGISVFACTQDEAELICNSVNSHADLVAALKELLDDCCCDNEQCPSPAHRHAWVALAQAEQR